MVVHRQQRDQLWVRLVWLGGATTELAVPIPVGSFQELSFAQAMEQQIVTLAQAGHRDEQIAAQLSEQGYRSPLRDVVLPSTVQTIRLKHGIMQKRSQSHRRHVTGALTVPQLAGVLGVVPHWIYDRIYKGTIETEKDQGLYLFPDTAETIQAFEQLKGGEVTRLRFSVPASSP